MMTFDILRATGILSNHTVTLNNILCTSDKIIYHRIIKKISKKHNIWSSSALCAKRRRCWGRGKIGLEE